MQEVRFAEDIDFKFPMRQACPEEINRFCSKLEPGGQRGEHTWYQSWDEACLSLPWTLQQCPTFWDALF